MIYTEDVPQFNKFISLHGLNRRVDDYGSISKRGDYIISKFKAGQTMVLRLDAATKGKKLDFTESLITV